MRPENWKIADTLESRAPHDGARYWLLSSKLHQFFLRCIYITLRILRPFQAGGCHMKWDNLKQKAITKTSHYKKIIKIETESYLTFVYLVRCSSLDALLEYAFHLHRQTYVTHRCLEIPHGKRCKQGDVHLSSSLDTYTLRWSLRRSYFQHTSFPFCRKSAHTNSLKIKTS